MSKYVLRPSRVVLNRILPVEGAEPLTLSFKEMLARFAPSGEIGAKAKIVGLRPGCYFGLLRDEQRQLRNFTIFIPSRDNKIDWHLRKDPTFPSRVVEIYEVERAERDAKLTEIEPLDAA